MVLIVGLGNSGEGYGDTRHNLGFMVLDKLSQKLTSLGETRWERNRKLLAETMRVKADLILAKPQTYMNKSGSSVKKMMSFYKIGLEDLWVVHDDVDLPLGKIKIRLGGASAGHHGVESIIEQLGTDHFLRFRLGIGHPRRGEEEDNVEAYVLKKFESQERSALKAILKRTIGAIEMVLDQGITVAMNRFN